MVIGPPGDIELLVARLTESIAQPGRGADASTIPPADMAALAATGVATLDASGRYVQLSSASLAAIKERMPDKTADGFYRMAVRGDGGRYAGQLVWKPANFNPVQAASLQTAAVGMALKMAIQDVQAAVARVEGKVDELLRLAKAERAGDVIGSFRVVSRIERHVSEGAPSSPPTGTRSLLSARRSKISQSACDSTSGRLFRRWTLGQISKTVLTRSVKSPRARC